MRQRCKNTGGLTHTAAAVHCVRGCSAFATTPCPLHHTPHHSPAAGSPSHPPAGTPSPAVSGAPPPSHSRGPARRDVLCVARGLVRCASACLKAQPAMPASRSPWDAQLQHAGVGAGRLPTRSLGRATPRPGTTPQSPVPAEALQSWGGGSRGTHARARMHMRARLHASVQVLARRRHTCPPPLAALPA